MAIKPRHTHMLCARLKNELYCLLATRPVSHLGRYEIVGNVGKFQRQTPNAAKSNGPKKANKFTYIPQVG